MDSRLLVVLLIAAFFTSVVAFPPLRFLKDSWNSNKHKSPQIYSFGGSENQRLRSVSYFNSSTDEWLPTTDMFTAKQTSCGAVVGTKIYLFGGYGKANHGSVKTAEVYDCETGTYDQLPSLMISRSGCGAAVLGDFIYVAAGWDNGKTLSSVVRYNIHTTRLEYVSPMHVKRCDFQLIELHGRLYAIGGRTKTVEVYSPICDRWSFVANTNYEHSFFGATVHQGRIYVCSREGCEAYSPDIDQWTTFTSSPNNYIGSTLVSMNDKLWALGGGLNAYDKTATKSVFTYDTFTRKWCQQPDMDVPRKNHVSFVVNH